MAALLTAFEAGTSEAIRAFIERNFSASALKETPVEERLRRISSMAREIGPLEFQKSLSDNGPEISFLARSRKSGDWLEVGLRLEPAPPYEILGVRFEQAEGPDATREKPLGSQADTVAAVEAYLDGLSRADEFSGVVLLAKDGKAFFHRAYGLANKDFGAPNRPDTRFNIGSITKAFTQVAIAQLAAEGRLSLSDAIRKHLPDYPSPAADRITIQQLLTMSSGLGDIFGERFQATPKDQLRSLSDYLPLFASQPLLFEPGTDRRYSNAGYIVLGLIIEKVSGRRYEEFVRERIFEKAGMTGSGAFDQDSVVPNRAVGYTRAGQNGPTPVPRIANIYRLPARSSSAGGSYATSEDLLAFDRAVRGEALLPPRWTDWFYSDKSKAPDAAAPTPATSRTRRSGGGGIAGGTDGANAVLETDLETGYTVVVLSNYDPPAAEAVARKIRQWLGLR